MKTFVLIRAPGPPPEFMAKVFHLIKERMRNIPSEKYVMRPRIEFGSAGSEFHLFTIREG
jgi:hypothetical protein